MKIRHLMGLGLAGLVLLAGCQQDDASSPLAATGAQAEVSAAIGKLATTPHRLTAELRSAKATGQLDPVAKNAALNIDGGGFTADLVGLGSDHYAKVAGLQPMGIDATKWYHVDGTRVNALSRFGITSVADPLGAVALSTAVKSAEKTGDRTYRGAFDLTRPAAGIGDKELKTLAERARNIPFEATLDDQGRLANLRFTVPARGEEPETPVTVAFTDYGVPVSVTKPPAGETVEAPEVVYAFLNG